MGESTYIYNLGQAFYQVTEKHAGRPALRYPDKTEFTYAELNKLSNQIAGYLLSKGLGKDDVLAIFNNKSVYAYSLMLACLKTGITYTNLDVSSPWQRIHKILDTCRPKCLFYELDENGLIDEITKALPQITLVELDSEPVKAEIAKQADSNLTDTAKIHGGQPAYIMFTSGSTGFPKGAVMSHNNVLNFIQWGQQTFSVTPDDIFTNVNPIYFDNSVFDFYTSIFSGACLTPIVAELTKNPKSLVKAIDDSECTIWFSVPSLLVYLLTTRALSKSDFTNIKRIAFGGEGFPKSKLKQLYDLFGDRIPLYNVYGPTECTCICSSYVISEKDFENMNELAPLGFVAPNFGYEILPLDESNPNLGELALTGPCVGLGYYRDPERTAKSFVQNPHKNYEQRMYKTGDLVMRDEKGHLHFRGRVDNQIKHMGYRIELEEIEAAFNSLPYIDEAGVIYEKITAELGQIKAFVSLANGAKEVSDIHEDLQRILPPYMLPKQIQLLEVLPKNRNGKIDRLQLAQIKS